MENTRTNVLAALAAVIIVVSTWAPVITVPAAQAVVGAPAIA